MNYLPQIADYLKLEIEILQNLNQESVNTLMNMMEQARLDGKRIFICGNGGSAATASHLLEVIQLVTGVYISSFTFFSYIITLGYMFFAIKEYKENGMEELPPEAFGGREDNL